MTNEQIKKLISNMTLEEKLGQMTQMNTAVMIDDTEVQTGALKWMNFPRPEDRYNICSVLNFSSFEKAKQVSDICLKNSTAKIPVINMMDVIHGYKTIYPIPLGLGATFDKDIVEECSMMAATEARANGVHVTFAPMVDLVRDARWGRCMESTGEDSLLNSILGCAQIRGFRKGGLLTCVKHFAAYGAVESGREYREADMSEYTLNNFYMRSYKECIEKEKPDLVMSSYTVLNGKPMNANHQLLVEVLRKKWGFKGVLISDYSAIAELKAHGYASTDEECAETAIKNEIDIEMVGTEYLRTLPKLLDQKKIRCDLIDKAVFRILKMKDKVGLFEDRYSGASEENAQHSVLTQYNRAVAKKAAEQSFVLLKNEDKILPLNRSAKILLTGHMAEEKDLTGGWWCVFSKNDTVSIKEGIENLIGESFKCIPCGSGELRETTNHEKINEVVAAAKDTEIAIVCIGEKSRMCGESCSRADLNIPTAQIELVKALRNQNKKVIAVVFGGRPLVLTELEKYSHAILYVWFPGTEGGNAIANVLYGESNPCGKLPMSFPRQTGQCPIYYNQTSTNRPKKNDNYFKPLDFVSSYQDEYNSPLYPFGFGLSYTSFSIKKCKLSKEEITEGDSIDIDVEISNDGKRAGAEVIQVYMHDLYAAFVRPVKELIAFQKVYLNAGETKKVKFVLREEMLRYYRNADEFVLEKGAIDIMIGLNSVELKTTRIERI